jgi:hypothetical protein
VLGEVQQAGVKNGVAVLVVAQPHRLHPVVQDFFRHATQVVEGVLVAAQQRRQGLGLTEIEVAGPRPAQREDEGLDAFPLRLAEGPPVGLPPVWPGASQTEPWSRAISLTDLPARHSA